MKALCLTRILLRQKNWQGCKQKMKIILDTNFLLIPGTLKVDIFSEINRICSFKYTLHIVDKTLDELNKIIETQRGKYRDAAKLALQLLKNKSVKIIKTTNGKNVDNLILGLARKARIVVATQDMEFKRLLKAENTHLIVLKQKKYLFLDI